MNYMFETILLLTILIILIAVTVIFSFNILSLPFTKGVPYVPLKEKQLNNIFNNVNLHKDARIVDIGCGDGRVLRILEKDGYKNLYGYEINPWPYLIGKVKNLFSKSKTKIILKNFEKVSLGEYDVIFCYLLKSYLKRLRPKFEKELKPGTKIISYAFEIEGWQPERIIFSNKKNKKLGRTFIYEIDYVKDIKDVKV